MKFVTNLFYKTFIGKVVKVIKSIRDYIKDYEYISDTFYSESFKLVLKEYLNLNIKKDWLGRLYGIINPNINKNNEFDITKTIIELDGENTNNNEYVKHWTYKQLTIIGEVFKINNLYHYIDLEFKHVGPQEGDNYLLIFDIVSRKIMSSNIKKLLMHGCIYVLIIIIAILIL